MAYHKEIDGITLIALVVTIVILIILATISVNIVMNGGLINRSQSGKEMHELQKEKERLELIKGEVASNTNHVGKVTVDTYVEELINQGITVEEDITDNGDGSKTVITDTGYSVTIVPKGENDVEIIIDGKAGALPPRISNIDLTRDSSAKTIEVDITVVRGEGASYNYYYKIDNGEWVEIEKDSNKTSVTISNIDIAKDYTIKVEATNEHGTVSKEKSSKAVKAGEEVEKPSTWDSEKVTAISDGKGGVVPLPDGYYYVGGDIDTGLVISDKAGDTMDASGVDMGSQFVWIPVPDEATFARTGFDTDGSTITLNASYTEPYASGYDTEASEYNTMKSQVLKYGGFFIGRFEAGVNSTTLRTNTTTAQSVVSKKGVAPYTWIPWGKAMNDITSDVTRAEHANITTPTKGAVYLAKNMYTHPDSVTSTLCYGSQWDAMCRYIGDCNRIAPTKSAPGLTGSDATDVSKNIYDLAGNYSEWTMEAQNSNLRVYRGGKWNNPTRVYARSSNYPYYENGNGISTIDVVTTFRLGIYIE